MPGPVSRRHQELPKLRQPSPPPTARIIHQRKGIRKKDSASSTFHLSQPASHAVDSGVLREFRQKAWKRYSLLSGQAHLEVKKNNRTRSDREKNLSVRREKANSFSHILVDCTGEGRGGHGDFMAAYLTAVDLVQTYGCKVSIAIDERAYSEFSHCLGQERVETQGVYPQFIDGNLASQETTVDLCLQVSSTHGLAPRLPHGFQSHERTVFLAETTFGREHQGIGSYVQVGNYKKALLGSAGIGESAKGVYFDPVASQLRQRPPEWVKNWLQTVSKTKNEKRLLPLLEGSKIQVGFLYPSPDNTVGDLSHCMTYIKSLPVRHQKATVLLCRSELLESDQIHRLKDVQIIRSEASLPRQLKKGTVYLIDTGFLSHAVFTGWLAYSHVPPMISGDGTLSACLELGIPFVFSPPVWGRNIVDALRVRLLKLTPHPHEQDLINQVYAVDTRLDQIMILRDHPEWFERLRESVPYLTDSIIDNAYNLRKEFDDRHSEVPSLIENLKATDPQIKIGALSLLSRYKLDQEVYEAILADLAIDPHPEVQKALIRYVPRLMGPERAEMFLHTHFFSNPKSHLQDLLRSLGQIIYMRMQEAKQNYYQSQSELKIRMDLLTPDTYRQLARWIQLIPLSQEANLEEEIIAFQKALADLYFLIQRAFYVRAEKNEDHEEEIVIKLIRSLDDLMDKIKTKIS